MVLIPSHFLASVPARKLLEGDYRVSLRIDRINCDVEKYKNHYSKRIFNFDIEDEIFLEDDLVRGLHGFRVRIKASDEVFRIGRILENYRRMVPVFFADVDESLFKKVNFLTGLGFQVHLNTENPPSDAGTLEKVLEFYLHNPLLKTPVEPFHSLLKTLSSGSGYTLWETEYENIKTNIFISDDNRVSLSKRWYGRGLIYGSAGDSWEELTASELYNNLKSFKKELFRRKSDCIYCAHMDICGGFLKAVDADWPCEAWISVFDILRREVADAREILQKYAEGNR